MAAGYGRWAERLMGMNEAVWARHANPYSVWTRIPILPLLVLSLWSRVWIGPWCALPVAVLLLWTWFNPRVFTAPERIQGWASKGVYGERIWLNRDTVPIAGHHAAMANLLTGISAIGAVLVIYGLIVLDAWATVFGTALAMLGKLWFVDRMVWLYEETDRQARERAAMPAKLTRRD
ncbi:MAG: DUF6653 family protein [Geminicoccaceae bacterium]